MKFFIDKEKYIDSGLVTEKEHPEFPLVIYNYSQECQFSKAWDEVTTMCRGLIVHKDTREIIARPFPKFFNYEEHIEKGLALPTEIPVVTDKMDGSLGIMYTWNSKTHFATRGSFTSDQAIWATNWWRENKGDEPYGNEVTHLFEIIYPENRIVVNYDFSGLVHLASIDTETGLQVEAMMPTKTVNKIAFSDIETLKALNTENSEGFVLFYPQANLRLKIKFAEYVRLHKIVTGLSAIGIWESLSEGQDIKLENIPDEFMNWYNDTKSKLVEDYLRIEKAAQELYNSIAMLESRKEQAIQIFKNGQRVSSIVFNIMDGRDYRKAIWRMVRPKGLQVFKKDIDA